MEVRTHIRSQVNRKAKGGREFRNVGCSSPFVYVKTPSSRHRIISDGTNEWMRRRYVDIFGGLCAFAPLHFELTPMKDTLVSRGNRQKNFDATVQDANEAKKNEK